MIRSFRCILVFSTVLIAVAMAQQSDPREGKLIVLERLWNEAQVSRDSSALDALIANRFVNTEWDGDVSDKIKFLADIRDPQYKPVSVSIQDVKVNFYGDTAIVTGVYHSKGVAQGKPYDHIGRFTDTWIFDSSKWQCVASHTSLLKK